MPELLNKVCQHIAIAHQVQAVTLVVGGGGYEDEYNGNDSLDFIINSEQDAAEHEVLEE